ncbi:MAG: prepilin-type N-terminal cleavage/methylation domain-containing protein, partial [Verrucomicrobiota bacterium]|nr:prepilin-type N-terminal cleavage/methylation domain-containing protein [Verrucomicrobiota bacterium]
MDAISTRCGRRTGFTLIEMLLVLSVFSLLIGIGVPRFIGWVGWNRQVQAMERLGIELSATGRTAIAAAAPLGLRAMPNRRGLEWIQGGQG